MTLYLQIISSPNLENILVGNSYIYSVINNIFPNKMKGDQNPKLLCHLKDKHISEKLNAKHNKMSHFP